MQAYMKSAQAEGKHFPQPPKGLSPEQLYFVSYGQTWCTKSDQEGAPTATRKSSGSVL